MSRSFAAKPARPVLKALLDRQGLVGRKVKWDRQGLLGRRAKWDRLESVRRSLTLLTIWQPSMSRSFAAKPARPVLKALLDRQGLLGRKVKWDRQGLLGRRVEWDRQGLKDRGVPWALLVPKPSAGRCDASGRYRERA
jgi:hypothetical protein